MPAKLTGKKYTPEQYIKERIEYFWQRKRTFEATESSFKEEKREFYEDMDAYFEKVANDDGKIIVDTKETVKGISTLICQKVAQVSIDFNVKKLRNVLTKEQAKRVIRKSYAVRDWPGLLNLLKKAGVDYSEFLKYVDVTEAASKGILEQLAALGEIDEDAVKACSSVNVKTQYYKITERNNTLKMRRDVSV